MDNILTLLHFDTVNPWLRGLIQSGIVIALAFGFIVFGNVIVTRLFYRISQIFDVSYDQQLIPEFRKLFHRVIGLIALNLIVESFPFHDKLINLIENITFLLILFYVLLGFFVIVDAAGGVLRKRAPEFELLVLRVGKIIVATIALMVGMRHFNYDIWHIMTALGVGTLAVGLAAQPTLTNMIAGFTILLDRPFRPGDRIALSGSDVVGDVMLIGMRSTRILTTDGNLLIVSNSELVNSRVINFSMPNQNYAQKVKFYVDSSSPTSEIKRFMQVALTSVPGITQESTSVYATNITDWGLEITVFYKVENFALTANIVDKIIDVVVTEFRKRNISFVSPPPGTALPNK